jgi:quercetin dioxygenase-like cupin family protein
VRLVRGGPASDRGAGDSGLSSDWLQGPASSPGSLDVGVVTLAPGVTTPLHMHLEGQVPMVMAGEGFVEADGKRLEIGPGDVVVAAPGEWHVHGANPRATLVHVSVSTGGYEIAGPLPG